MKRKNISGVEKKKKKKKLSANIFSIFHFPLLLLLLSLLIVILLGSAGTYHTIAIKDITPLSSWTSSLKWLFGDTHGSVLLALGGETLVEEILLVGKAGGDLPEEGGPDNLTSWWEFLSH